MQSNMVNISALFQACGIKTEDVYILETEGMYPYKQVVEENWAYYTAKALQRLKFLLDKEGKKIETAGIVGICSGVEGIALARVFQETLKSMIVTDIDEEILQGTLQNLKAATQGVTILPKVGLFCEPIQKTNIFVDLVHANIPNLPTSGGEDLSKGDEKGSFAPPNYYEKYNPKEQFIHFALPAQYAYLQSAKKIIKEGGTIIAEIGGRMPFEILEDLFAACDLEMQELVVGFKKQTEARINFSGYHKNELEYGVCFEYYLYEESMSFLKEKGFQNPDFQFSTIQIKKWLEPYKISAGEALRLYEEKGIIAGHIVQLLRGIKNKEKNET